MIFFSFLKYQEDEEEALREAMEGTMQREEEEERGEGVLGASGTFFCQALLLLMHSRQAKSPLYTLFSHRGRRRPTRTPPRPPIDPRRQAEARPGRRQRAQGDAGDAHGRGGGDGGGRREGHTGEGRMINYVVKYERNKCDFSKMEG